MDSTGAANALCPILLQLWNGILKTFSLTILLNFHKEDFNLKTYRQPRSRKSINKMCCYFSFGALFPLVISFRESLMNFAAYILEIVNILYSWHHAANFYAHEWIKQNRKLFFWNMSGKVFRFFHPLNCKFSRWIIHVPKVIYHFSNGIFTNETDKFQTR